MTGPRRNRQGPREVFLSHATKDRRTAAKLADWLRAHGVPVWLSKTHLIGGQQWHEEIGAALKRCDWFVLLLSPHAVVSKWVKFEYLEALRNRNFDDRILPVLLRPCGVKPLSWTLAQIQTIDFCERSESAREAILRALGIPAGSKLKP